MNERFLRVRKRITAVSLVWLVRVIRLFASMVPYRMGVSAGGAIGFAAFYFLRRERNRVVTHLDQTFK